MKTKANAARGDAVEVSYQCRDALALGGPMCALGDRYEELEDGRSSLTQGEGDERTLGDEEVSR